MANTTNNQTPDEILEDKLFIQEIINDLEKKGYQRGGKAQQMLRDWSSEKSATYKEKTGIRIQTKKRFAEIVGRYLW